jgi:hypothetical protein
MSEASNRLTISLTPHKAARVASGESAPARVSGCPYAYAAISASVAANDI